jgi:hypothetical protein
MKILEIYDNQYKLYNITFFFESIKYFIHKKYYCVDTLLYFAISNGYRKFALYLVKNGAGIYINDDDNKAISSYIKKYNYWNNYFSKKINYM